MLLDYTTRHVCNYFSNVPDLIILPVIIGLLLPVIIGLLSRTMTLPSPNNVKLPNISSCTVDIRLWDSPGLYARGLYATRL